MFGGNWLQRLRWTLILGLLILTVAYPALFITSAWACSPGSSDYLDYGAVELGEKKCIIDTWNSTCATSINGINLTGDKADITYSQNGPNASYHPGCVGYTWGSNNLGSNCYLKVCFSPQATGQRSAAITPTTTNGVVAGTAYRYGAGFSLSSPQEVDPRTQDPALNTNDFALVLPSPQPTSSPFAAGYTSITLDSGNASVKWTGNLNYQTSGGLPKSPATLPVAGFSTNSSTYTVAFGTPIPGAPTPNASYAVAGGKFTLKVTYNAGAPNDPVTNQVSPWVTGIPGGILDTAITSELCSVYANENGKSPATRGLFTLIAWQESHYHHFMDLVANGLDSLWPNESPSKKRAPSGTYIGLLQVALQEQQGNDTPFGPMDTAWNWLDNSQVGYDIFTEKIGIALQIQNAQINNHCQTQSNCLQALTLYQLENMALLQYGTRIGAKLNKQYFTPKCVNGTGKTCTGGQWQWVENPIYNGTTTYADSVRNPLPNGNPTSATCS